MNTQKTLSRPQILLFFFLFTASIAMGLVLFSSASTAYTLFRTATTGLFLPFLLALILTFFLEPAVRQGEKKGLSRTSSIFSVYCVLSIVFYLLALWFIPYWREMWISLKGDLPRYTSELITFVKGHQSNLQNRLPFLEAYDLSTKARTIAEQFLADILAQTPKSAMRLGSLLVLVPLLSFFLLRDGNAMMRSFVALVPNRYFEMSHNLIYLVTRQLAQFIRGRLIEAFIVGLVVSIGLSFTEIRYVPILGIIAGVTNLIPYIGPIIGMVPGILIAFVDLGMGGEFWWIIAVYILIAQVLVDNFILIPILISRVSNLHPLWVILAIIMGGKIYGVIGMIIGVPIASIIKIAILEIRQYRKAFSLSTTLVE